jgi:hypothetical protein
MLIMQAGYTRLPIDNDEVWAQKNSGDAALHHRYSSGWSTQIPLYG